MMIPTCFDKKQFNQLIFSVIVVIFLFIFVEALSLGGLFVLEKFKNLHYTPLPEVSLSEKQNEVIRKLLSGQTGHAVYHRQLGWSLHSKAKTNDYQINSQSIRATVEYEKTPPNGKIRIAAFGDSFTFGQGVTNEETWEYFLQLLDPRYETLNFGVGGYGQDQAYLRYELEGQQFKTNIVMIGFISENVFRNVNVFRPFYEPLTEFPLTKPRYILNNGELELIDNPMASLEQYHMLLDQPQLTIQQLGQRDYFYHQLYHRGPWDVLAVSRLMKVFMYQISSKYRDDALFLKNDVFSPRSEGFLLATKIYDQFYQKVKLNGAAPLIVVLPTQRDLSRMKAGLEKRYKPFIDYWTSKHYQVVDVNELVFIEGIDVLDRQWYTEDGHNSGLLHQRIAAHLHEYLKRSGIIEKEIDQ